MKKWSLIAGALLVLSAGCAPKYGCPTSGAAQGAEKVLSGDPKTAKAIKKSKWKKGL